MIQTRFLFIPYLFLPVNERLHSSDSVATAGQLLLSFVKNCESKKEEDDMDDYVYISTIPYQGIPFYVFPGAAMYKCRFRPDRCKPKKTAAAREQSQNVSIPHDYWKNSS